MPVTDNNPRLATMYPIWETLWNASRRRSSYWESAASTPSSAEAAPTQTSTVGSDVPDSSRGEMRNSEYAPSLVMMPAKKAAIGALGAG